MYNLHKIDLLKLDKCLHSVADSFCSPLAVWYHSGFLTLLFWHRLVSAAFFTFPFKHVLRLADGNGSLRTDNDNLHVLVNSDWWILIALGNYSRLGIRRSYEPEYNLVISSSRIPQALISRSSTFNICIVVVVCLLQGQQLPILVIPSHLRFVFVFNCDDGLAGCIP